MFRMENFKNHLNLMGKTVLIVEEYSKLRNMMAYILSYGGANVVESCNYEESLNIINREKIDVVLMDINMLFINEMRVLRSKKNHDNSKSIPTIIVSSDHTKLDELSCDLENEQGYLYKPFTATDLLQKTAEVLSLD